MTDSQRIEPPMRPSLWRQLREAEDWWAIWCGGLILIGALLAVGSTMSTQLQATAPDGGQVKLTSPLKNYLATPGFWTDSPIEAFAQAATATTSSRSRTPGILGALVVIGGLFTLAMQVRSGSGLAFLKAFPLVFLLALLAYLLSNQVVIDAYNLEFALWALLLGLLVSNTLGTPRWLHPAVLPEFYIKTGLVLLGAEVLLDRLWALGKPGIVVSWLVTPTVLIGTYIFGQRVLKIPSRSLNMVISADMSVCGVSAAIATAAACRAKKEELSLAISISLLFTVVMMVVQPLVVQALGMSAEVGGAWIGGTIDSTGAVAAAGAALGKRGEEVAVTVKMIQNVLIGVTAFGVAIYWAMFVERDPSGVRLGAGEIWYRFPKFVLGFVGASLLCTWIQTSFDQGANLLQATISDSTIVLRKWLFCLAFVSIGLATNFRALAPYLRGGKPLLLYLCGQSFNLLLTLLMAWLMFGVVSREALR